MFPTDYWYAILDAGEVRRGKVIGARRLGVDLAVWRDFLDALDAGRAPAVDGAQALRVHRLIDALLASGAAGGAPVRVEA